MARCWPSEEALNASLRLAVTAETQAQKERGSDAKCPVPRPILNILMRRASSNVGGAPTQKGRSSEQYVADQIKAFGERYGSLPGYNYAEAYLESVLILATTGEESPRTKEVGLSGGCGRTACHFTRPTLTMKPYHRFWSPVSTTNPTNVSLRS